MKLQTIQHAVCCPAGSGRARRLAAALAATTALIAPTLAHAAPQSTAADAQASATPPADAALEDIIVTAQKRSENLQDVPLSVVAVTAQDALVRGITGTQALTSSVPGLVITSPANVGNPYLRGVGSALFDPSAEQAVAMYVDGVYISAPQTNIFSFNNIQQVEVLRGPQGTLFGRNATGGVIQITTVRPSSKPALDVGLGYGNYDTVTASAYVTGGLSDTISADLAGLYENQGKGFGRNLTLGRDQDHQARGNYSLRSKILFEPSSDTTITLAGDYAHSVSTNAYQKPKGLISPIDGVTTYPGAFNSTNSRYNRDRVNTGGVSLRLDQKIGSLSLMNLMSYRRSDVKYDLDNDVTNLVAVDVQLNPAAHNFSEEIQLSGQDNPKFQWVVGAFYFNATGEYQKIPFFLQNGSFVRLQEDKQVSVSYAAFGQATAQILENTDLTLGLRYTTEKQDFTLTYPQSKSEDQSFNKLTYRIALNHHFSDDVMGYLSYNRGFKSGGFNLRLPGTLTTPANTFKPETLDAYEVGFKTELLDRRLRFNIGAFLYKDKNVQVLRSFLGGTITSNAAAATLKGIEMDFEAAITRSLHLSGGLSLQRGKYDSYPNGVRLTPDGIQTLDVNLAGNRTIVTPPFSGTATASYDIELGGGGKLQPALTVVYNDGFYWQPENRLTQPSYTLVNASLLWTSADKRLDARLWAKNLTNARYYIARLGVSNLGDVQEHAPPRTYGVSIGLHL